jgi:hypothetical protein
MKTDKFKITDRGKERQGILYICTGERAPNFFLLNIFIAFNNNTQIIRDERCTLPPLMGTVTDRPAQLRWGWQLRELRWRRRARQKRSWHVFQRRQQGGEAVDDTWEQGGEDGDSGGGEIMQDRGERRRSPSPSTPRNSSTSLRCLRVLLAGSVVTSGEDSVGASLPAGVATAGAATSAEGS